jgi:DNA-directed RNA polymerase I, II, and III subunit RPABC2
MLRRSQFIDLITIVHSEPAFDEPEEPDFDEPDDVNQEVGGGADEDTRDAENIVASGDQQAARRAEEEAKKKNKNTVAAEKEKMIPREERKTTPYMTKYEKARVLGTRALQIRYAYPEVVYMAIHSEEH